MNMKSTFLASLFTVAAVATAATEPTALETLGADPAATPAVAHEMLQPAKGSDLIQLNEPDDSADAREGQVKVKPSAEKKGRAEKSESEMFEGLSDDLEPSKLAVAEKLAKKADAEVAKKPEASPAPAAKPEIAKKDEAEKTIVENGVDNPTTERPNASQGLFETKYTRNDEQLFDITCENATLSDVLRQFRHVTGSNIISSESTNLGQRVSLTLNRVSWKDALKSILGLKKFRLENRGEIYIVSEDPVKEPEYTRSFILNHAPAQELARLFNTTFGKMQYDTKGVPKEKIGHQVATAFEGANVVVVTATEKVLEDCEIIIKSVDVAVPQIYIEARFIEVTNEALHKLGVQWDSLKSWGATVKGLNGGLEYNTGRLQPWTAAPQAGATGAGRGKGDEDEKALPNNILDWHTARGFSGQLSADDFRLALSAFETLEDAKIFSNPKIIVSNGKEAKVDMTTKFPNVRIQATRNDTSGNTSYDISTQLEVIPGEEKMLFAKNAFFWWGIELSVKPRISPDGLISVEIIPQISDLEITPASPDGFLTVTSGDSTKLAPDERPIMSKYPVIGTKRLISTFTMKDGATAVIGGLSKTNEDDIDSGIPYLRKIPWIGPKIFGWKSRGLVQKEIIVFVTVGIADPADLPADAGLPTNAVAGRDYVEGRKFEPGKRAGGVQKLMEFDTRPIEEKRKDVAGREESPAPGTVTITPSKK